MSIQCVVKSSNEKQGFSRKIVVGCITESPKASFMDFAMSSVQ